MLKLKEYTKGYACRLRILKIGQYVFSLLSYSVRVSIDEVYLAE
jgi:hypothetical protein